MMPDDVVGAKAVYNAFRDLRWRRVLDPAGVGDFLDEVAKEALGLATVWRLVVSELINGHIELSTEEFKRLCWRYDLGPRPNGRPYYRLSEFHRRLFNDDPSSAGLTSSVIDELHQALEAMIWRRGEAVQLVDLFLQTRLAKAGPDLESILKQVSGHVTAIEKEAASIHVLATEVRTLSAADLSTSVRILFLAANTTASTGLALDEEYREIKLKIRAAEHRDSLALAAIFATRPHDIHQALLEEKPTIVHFSGHGEGEPGLVFHGETADEEKLVTADALEHLFSVLPDNLRLVVLNACYSEVQANAIVKVIDYVVGMKASIGDRAARLFAASFYLALGFGRSIRTAFDLGVNAIRLEGLVSDQNLPVLLVRPGMSAETSLLS